MSGMGSSGQELTGARRAAYQTFRALIAVFTIGTPLMFYLAGAGVFGAKDEGFEAAKSFDPHAAVGTLLTLVVLLALIAAAIARPGRNLVRSTGLLFLLMVVQNVLGATGADARWVMGGLHPLNGVLITATALYVTAVAFGWRRSVSMIDLAEPDRRAAAAAETTAATTTR